MNLQSQLTTINREDIEGVITLSLRAKTDHSHSVARRHTDSRS